MSTKKIFFSIFTTLTYTIKKGVNVLDVKKVFYLKTSINYENLILSVVYVRKMLSSSHSTLCLFWQLAIWHPFLTHCHFYRNLPLGLIHKILKCLDLKMYLIFYMVNSWKFNIPHRILKHRIFISFETKKL